MRAGRRNTELPIGIPRGIEVIVALLALVAVAPIIALAAIAIAINSHGPILFRQQRVGRNGCTFVLYKLRTMRSAAMGPQVTAGDDPRVTWIGRILRKSKVDELPEFWNVLKGDMSLVGPRPEMPSYVTLDCLTWQLVLRARPGLTDPVTLRLRNEESLLAGVPGDREEFYLDTLQPFKLLGYAEYLQERSWRSDVRILLKTVRAVILPDKAPLPTLDEIKAHAQRHRVGGNCSCAVISRPSN